MKFDIHQYLKTNQQRIDRALDRLLPKPSDPPTLLHQALRYSIFAGGKRLRPILVIAGAETCGGHWKQVLPTACAMELIHTYSLIHDDLPAMDDDDLRRGRPTNHKVFGEDIAILAGDGLLTLAFQLIEQNRSFRGILAESVLEVIKIVARGAGVAGMVGGQAADITSDQGRWKKASLVAKNITPRLTPQQLLKFIHSKKTAALISASVCAGGILAGAKGRRLEALKSYGLHLGLAFQIMDDILDVVGDKKKLGKKGSDGANQKLTYPLIFGLEKSKKMAIEHTRKAIVLLHIFDNQSFVLNNLANHYLSRDY